LYFAFVGFGLGAYFLHEKQHAEEGNVNLEYSSIDFSGNYVEIKNEFSLEPDFLGFAKSSQYGSKMKFFHDEQNEEVFTTFTVDKKHSGYPNVAHNGLLVCYLLLFCCIKPVDVSLG
jgi:hypothetical protein